MWFEKRVFHQFVNILSLKVCERMRYLPDEPDEALLSLWVNSAPSILLL